MALLLALSDVLPARDGDQGQLSTYRFKVA